MGRNRRRIYALIGAAAIAGAVLAVMPAFGDSEREALRLHLGSDGQNFEFGEFRHPLTATRCEVNPPPSPTSDTATNQNLMDMTATASNGSPRKVGLDSLGIGVKTGGSQGVPCGRIDTSEILTLEVPANGPLGGREFDGLRFDLELKGSAWVEVRLFLNGVPLEGDPFELATGSSIAASGFDNPGDVNPEGGYTAESTSTKRGASCAGTADSGPDSGPNDNCLWTIDPGTTFDKIVLRAKAGEFSLEGSGDFGSNRDFDTLFYLANAVPVANDDAVTTTEKLKIDSVNVLGNDTDADLDELTVVSINTSGDLATETPATIGEVELINGVVSYDPEDNFFYLNVGETATDYFFYTISDGKGGSDTAKVTVTITGVNDPPVVGGEFELDQRGELVMRVATDVDDDTIYVDCDVPNLLDREGLPIPVLDEAGVPVVDENNDPVYLKIGTFTDNEDGTVTFIPADGFYTDAAGIEISCTASDPGGEEDTENITVVVNPVPIAVDDEAYTDGDTALTVDVLANDRLAGSSDIRILSIGDPTVGGVEVVDEEILFTPPPGFTGQSTFTYTITDDICADGSESCEVGGLRTDTATVTVYELFKCGETLGLRQHGVTANYTRLFPVGGSGCDDDGKPYDLSIDNSDPAKPVVVFVPRSIGDPLDCLEDPCPRFSAELIFPPRPATPGLSNTGTLQWYPDATVGSPDPDDWIDMPWCLSAEVGMVGVQRAVLNAELPTGLGEGWCIGFVETRPAVPADFEGGVAIANHSVTTWYVYGIGDPLKRVS